MLKFKLKGCFEVRLKSVELYAVHTKISKPLLNMYCFLLGAGIIDELCPEINQITNRWWISEAVGAGASA
ncbi:MAG: hypothetical protein AAF349_27425, partial [Cyanobacteria bacterium P01_A01_bin.68]